jgi:hypothetical protein
VVLIRDGGNDDENVVGATAAAVAAADVVGADVVSAVVMAR